MQKHQKFADCIEAMNMTTQSADFAQAKSVLYLHSEGATSLDLDIVCLLLH